MKRLGFLVLCLAVWLGTSGSALAESGRQDFVITYAGSLAAALTNSPGRTVIATGVITGVGEEEFLSQQEGPSGTFVGSSNFVFPEGSVTVSVEGVAEPHFFGPGGCFIRNTIRGTYEITGGTGAFSGASGSGEFSGVNIVLASPSDTGCSVESARLVSSIRLRGVIVLPNDAAA